MKTKKKNLLKAEIEEYKHALQHVIQCGSCEQCSNLVESALNGVNRKEFLQTVLWHEGKGK